MHDQSAEHLIANINLGLFKFSDMVIVLAYYARVDLPLAVIVLIWMVSMNTHLFSGVIT
jgi:hypothetical protein